VWRVRDGLPSAWIRSVAQTPDGYLWIATAGGLGRHDGAGVSTIPTDGALLRLGDLIDLGVGRDGTLWLLPSFGEPACRRGRTLGGCFRGRLSPAGMPRPYLFEEAPSGAIWLASREGLSRFADGRLALVYPAAGLPFQRPNAIHVDRRQRLWVAAPNGLFVEENGTFRPHRGPSGPAAFHERPGGPLWVASGRALVRIDLDSGATTTHEHEFPAARPTRMIEDRDGNLWIGSYGGLVRFRDGRFDTFTTRDGLPDDDVTVLFEDREASLWVGTRSGGLTQFTDRTLDTRSGPPGLRGARVESVAEDASGALWFGSHGGLTRWRQGVEHTFRTADGLPSDYVTAVLPAADGQLWVGTDRGLVRHHQGQFQPVGSGVVSSLFLDRAGTLWVGTEDGLGRLQGGRVQAVRNQADFDPGVVRGIQQDGQGRIWAAAAGGLARMDGDTLTKVARMEGAYLRHARALHVDPAGTLWIGTARSGLVRLQGGRAQTYDASVGINFDQLYQMLTDDLGFLWIGTSRGILRADKAVLEQVARGQQQRVDPIWFDTDDTRRDVSATRARQPGAWKTRDGRLWFATDQGVVTIDPRRLRLNTVPPPVWIEDFEVDGRVARRDDPHRFPPGAGTVEFHFAGVTLLESRKVAHRYRLDGFDQRWVDAGTRRAAYYTNLPPGNYRFRVQARNADGVWNDGGDSVELVLAPHLYQTVWFYGLVILAIAAIVLSAHRAHVGRVRAEYRAVLAERARVARELHDSLLQGMSAVAMQIYGLRKRLVRSAPPRPPETIARDLEGIEEVVAAGLEETRRFVWNLRDPSERPLPAAVRHLVDRLTATSSVEVRVEVEGKPAPLPAGVETELLRIAQEALANALKHAEARHIEVRLCYEGGGVKLSVSDDGRGFEPDQAPGAGAGHFGLVGLRERAARLGPLTISSRPGEGTRVEVTVSAETASRDGQGHG
jgi:signal transduction histidine kinase/ligand-binding sensor domain-containing protein